MHTYYSKIQKNLSLIFCVALLAGLTGISSVTSCKKKSTYAPVDPPAREKTISELVDADRIMKSLGKDWKRHQGVIVDKLADIDKFTDTAKQMMQALVKDVEPHGVIAFGEFSFSRTVFPLDNLTIRIFRFATPEKAAAFRKLKYENEKAKPLYDKTENESTIIYDSLQINKRIVFHDALCVTCSHLADDDLHIRMLEKYVTLE